MVSSLEEIDRLIGDAVHQSVFLSDTPRPTAGEYMFQRFGLSRTFERIPRDCLNEVEDSDRYATLVFDPKPEVLKKLGLKNSDPSRMSLHRASLSAERLLSRVLAFPSLPVEAPKTDGARSAGSGAGERSP
jgi:hypothetical protein